MYFGSNSHTTQEESADSSRRNVAGPILYCHGYKITCGTRYAIALRARQSHAKKKNTGVAIVKASIECMLKMLRRLDHLFYLPRIPGRI